MLSEDLYHICKLNLLYIIHFMQRVGKTLKIVLLIEYCFRTCKNLDHILFSIFDYSDIISNVLCNKKLTIINLYVFPNSISAFLSCFIFTGIIN